MKAAPLLWQQPGWPALRYDAIQAADALALTQRAQGLIEGKLAALGFEARQQWVADAWAQEAMSTAAIEGEQLDLLAVRSSIARRLGAAPIKSAASPRHVDGLLDVMADAVDRADAPLTDARLCSWQAALFPTGYSGLRPILVGAYRIHTEPMQIVSGPVGREKVHYEAPASDKVPAEMAKFLAWANDGVAEPSALVKAALAHLCFETIHPFEDGNGRVGRAIVDLLLARAAKGTASRLIRISQRLLEKREDYYAELGRAQHGPLDVTPWVVWFITQVRVACEQASAIADLSLAKARFWSEHRERDLSARQRKVVNLLLDAGSGGFEGGMSTKKYENLTGASRATASRELIELAALGLLRVEGAGRSTRYEITLANSLVAGDGGQPQER